MRTKMIQSIAVIGMLAIAIAGCKSTKKSDTTTENVMVSAVSKPVGKDTITIKNIRRVQRDSLGLFAVVFDVPTSGSDIMKNAITEWISEELEGSYEGELTDVEKMADYYMDKVLKRNYETASEFKAESGQDQLNYEDSTTINKFYESDAFITYSYVSDGYTGGAHGYHIYKGQTFRKSDGLHPEPGPGGGGLHHPPRGRGVCLSARGERGRYADGQGQLFCQAFARLSSSL